jgi:predicted enzyme related to lactoylglutathione lyase
MGAHTLAVFPYDDDAVGGCLMAGAGIEPSSQGALVYPECQAIARCRARPGRSRGWPHRHAQGTAAR